jgi:23S rRNA (pseudouridine1915-N3)-methyltransferase
LRLNLKFIFCGKAKDNYIALGVDKYIKILKKYGKVEVAEIKTNNQALENSKIIKELRNNSFKIFLDLSGKESSSENMAKFFKTKIDSGFGFYDFVIGGAFGFDKNVLKHADFIWKLSELTFNHQMVRLLLLEQVYRILSIINGETYHH